jgi:hypothetical protein
VTEDDAPDAARDSRPVARIGSVVGTVLSIAVALLLAALPGGSVNSARLQSPLGAASADQTVLAIANRFGEARASLQKARGPNARRPDFGGTPVLFAALAATLVLIAGAWLFRPLPVRAQRPARWPSTARARAPPRF